MDPLLGRTVAEWLLAAGGKCRSTFQLSPLLFGPLGVLFAFPLTIVADIAIRRLYVRDTLDKPVEILGEPAARSEVHTRQ